MHRSDTAKSVMMIQLHAVHLQNYAENTEISVSAKQFTVLTVTFLSASSLNGKHFGMSKHYGAWPACTPAGLLKSQNYYLLSLTLIIDSFQFKAGRVPLSALARQELKSLQNSILALKTYL